MKKLEDYIYYQGINGTLYHGDSFHIIPLLQISCDMILSDPPYHTTCNPWDRKINLQNMWEQYLKLIKPHGAIVLTAQTPFDKILGCSNLSLLRYEWIWEKTRPTGHLNAKRMPMKVHENILVFYQKLPTYHPQKTYGHNPVNKVYGRGMKSPASNYNSFDYHDGGGQTDRYPRDIITISNINGYDLNEKTEHPTQKPVALFSYLIQTYTNVNDIVLDNFGGSGTTAVSCVRCDRRYIIIEKEEKYCRIAKKRIITEEQQMKLGLKEML